MLNNIAGVLAPQVPTPTGDYESIASAAGTGSSNTITFTSIPSTFKHLQIRLNALSTGAADWISIRVNGDTTSANYYSHRLTGSGSGTPSSAAQGSQPYLKYSLVNGSTSYPAAAIIDVLDYQKTNKYKTFRTLSGSDKNGSGDIIFTSGLWLQTTAINQIEIILDSSNFTTASSFALYGIKG